MGACLLLWWESCSKGPRAVGLQEPGVGSQALQIREQALGAPAAEQGPQRAQHSRRVLLGPHPEGVQRQARPLDLLLRDGAAFQKGT